MISSNYNLLVLALKNILLLGDSNDEIQQVLRILTVFQKSVSQALKHTLDLLQLPAYKHVPYSHITNYMHLYTSR